MEDRPKKLAIIAGGVHAQALALSLARLSSLKHLIVILKDKEDAEEEAKRRRLTAFDSVEEHAQVAMAEAMKDMEIVAKKASPVIETLGKVVDSMPTKMKHHNYWPLGKKQGGRKHKKHCR